MKRSITTLNSEKRHPGPNLLILVIVYTLLMLAGAVNAKSSFGIPHDSAASAAAYVAAKGSSIQWGAFFELGSAIPLGVFIATVVSRLRFLGVRAAGESIAYLGGICTTLMLMLSALSEWALTRPGIADHDGAVRVLQSFEYIGGGPGFIVPFGLFLAGVSVTAGLSKLIPRWLMGLGLFLALASELASLSLTYFPAGYLIPVGRFGGVLWMIGLAITLPAAVAVPSNQPEANSAPSL